MRRSTCWCPTANCRWCAAAPPTAAPCWSARRPPPGRAPPAPEALEPLADGLPYMAPEQTGRIQRPIDARTDLYALGVVLYEMLTGVPPFHAGDPIAWVHCHVAQVPVTPHARVASVPAQLSAIVMKLLGKTAEERYQTASGVAADLRRCRGVWARTGATDAFPAGADDGPDRL